MVGEDDVQQRLRELRREAVDRLDLAAHAVVAERDLALQAPVVGELDRRPLAGVRVELADVVQQRAGDGDIAVDPGKVAEIALTAWPTRQQCSSSPWR